MAVKTSQKALKIAERRLMALTLRKSGASFQLIAENVSRVMGIENYNKSRAYKDVAAILGELKETTRVEAASFQQLELECLEMAMLAVSPQVRAGHLGAIGQWVRLLESRRKLLGLDAPVQIQVQQLMEAERNEFFDELEAILPAEIYDQVLEAIALDADRSTAAPNN